MRINIKMLPFAVAASASSPKNRPTQTALIEPFNDCKADEPRVGKANSSMVLAIDPWVRSWLLAVEAVVLLNVYPCAPSKLAVFYDIKTLIIDDLAYSILVRLVTFFYIMY